MDIRWLQDFLMLAETGNFTRAAERRNASQAAFSRRIQSLEAWAGAALIDRSGYPARLTPAGEQFRVRAAGIVAEAIEARTEVSGGMTGRPEHLRIALPYVLATSSLARWWPEWSNGRGLTCSVTLGNILELVTSLLSDQVDIMFCYESAQQPVHLDAEGFERLEVADDRLAPFASRDLVSRLKLQLPPRAGTVPLLMYTPGVYFARLVDLILDAQPQRLAGQRVIESDMSDVLRDLALGGNGIAWLPESCLREMDSQLLARLGGENWTMPLSIIAFRRKDNRRPAVMRLWQKLAQGTRAQAMRQPVNRTSRKPA
jgi:LysR family transcriptional regulator, hypochlorite-specific transcription factor HypT